MKSFFVLLRAFLRAFCKPKKWEAEMDQETRKVEGPDIIIIDHCTFDVNTLKMLVEV